MYSPPFIQKISAIYIINLPARTDRLSEMADQLALIGMHLNHDRVTVFPAIRPNSPGEFPSIGARGCFMSHLGVLRDAKNKGYESILILEDDADFSSGFLNSKQEVTSLIENDNCDILYLGHDFHKEALPPPLRTMFF